MDKRKLFLLFFSAMTISIILMLIIYGVFLKDVDFNFNVKNPDAAPSPVEIQDNTETTTPEPVLSTDPVDPANVNTPVENTEASEGNTETPTVPETPTIQPGPSPAASSSKPNVSSSAGSSGLHYVYLDGFGSKEAAEQAIQQLQGKNLPTQPYLRQHHGQVVVQFGVYSDKVNAQAQAQQLRGQGVNAKVE